MLPGTGEGQDGSGMATDEGSARDGRHVFISHHSSQYDAARRVKAALVQAGIRGWLAPDDIDPGAAFDQQILAGIRDARAMVLLLCAESDRSRHVKREIMLADDAGTAIYPMRLEPVKADGLAYWLKDRQWIDWFDGRGDGLDRLVTALGEGDDGAGRSPVGAPVAPAKRTRKTRLIAGGAAVLVAAAAIAGWALFGRSAAPEPYLRSGLWLNKREMIALTYPPKVPEEETRQIKDMVENDPNPEECISEDVARKPDVRLFDPGNKGGCGLTGFQMGGGRMSGYLTCPVQGVKDGSMSIVFRGTYSRDSIVMDSDVTIGQPSGSLRFKARDSSHWVADKCPIENR